MRREFGGCGLCGVDLIESIVGSACPRGKSNETVVEESMHREFVRELVVERWQLCQQREHARDYRSNDRFSTGLRVYGDRVRDTPS